MIRYHAAERLASDLLLPIDANEDTALQAWRDSYRVKHKREPELAECEAASVIVRRRLGGEPPPLPPSASGTWRRPTSLTYVLVDAAEECG